MNLGLGEREGAPSYFAVTAAGNYSKFYNFGGPVFAVIIRLRVFHSVFLDSL